MLRIHVQGKRPRKVSKPYAMVATATSSTDASVAVALQQAESESQQSTVCQSATDSCRLMTKLDDLKMTSSSILYSIRGVKDIHAFDHIQPPNMSSGSGNTDSSTTILAATASNDVINSFEQSHKSKLEIENDVWESLLGLSY